MLDYDRVAVIDPSSTLVEGLPELLYIDIRILLVNYANHYVTSQGHWLWFMYELYLLKDGLTSQGYGLTLCA